MLNEGLEALGTDEYKDDGGYYNGVFQRSAIESVTLPSTLKTIAYSVFCKCKSLTDLVLPSALEQFGEMCFAESSIRLIAIPDGITEIPYGAFYGCANLTSVTFG